MTFTPLSELILGPYEYTKACYLCRKIAPNPVTASSTCSYCGEKAVVYCLGRQILTTSVVKGLRRFFTVPTRTTEFLIQWSDNIEWQKQLGLTPSDRPVGNLPLVRTASAPSEDSPPVSLDTKLAEAAAVAARMQFAYALRYTPTNLPRRAWTVTAGVWAEDLMYIGPQSLTPVEALDHFIAYFQNKTSPTEI